MWLKHCDQYVFQDDIFLFVPLQLIIKKVIGKLLWFFNLYGFFLLNFIENASNDSPDSMCKINVIIFLNQMSIIYQSIDPIVVMMTNLFILKFKNQGFSVICL